MRLMYITSNPTVAKVAESAGVDWIFVDLEREGKAKRQHGRDTLISTHSLDDVMVVRDAISRSKLLVRVNPWLWSAGSEIEAVIRAGADIVMLPYFRTVDEVRGFVDQVSGRIKTCLLVETLEALRDLKKIMSIPGIDYVHIGLNDLHIARKTLFMFEFLSDGSMDRVAEILHRASVPFGFGGIARVGQLMPPAERLLAEHIRLGSTGVILSRSFFNQSDLTRSDIDAAVFRSEVHKLRMVEEACRHKDIEYFEENRRLVVSEIASVVESLRR